MAEVKRCPRCQLVLPLEQFTADPTKAAGVKSWCRSCDAARAATYRAAQFERERARQRTYQRQRYAARGTNREVGAQHE